MTEIGADVKAEKNRYISYMMNKLPETEKGEAKVLKKGDSLWNIAKEAVGGSKATNAEISEYMLLLAKANGLDTYDKMNKLKASDTIYMPKVSVKKTGKTVGAKPKKTANDAEVSARTAISKVFSNKDVKIENAALPFNSSLYHVYAMDFGDGVSAKRYRPVLSFNYSNGKMSNITFENEKEDLFTGGYDYRMEADGSIYQRGRLVENKVGTIAKEEVDNLKSKMEELLPTAKRVL